MQLQCRVESYLYKDAQPLVTTDAGGAAPPAPATEGTLSAVRDAAEVVSKCVNTSNNHLKVDIANDTLSGAIDVGLVQGGRAERRALSKANEEINERGRRRRRDGV